MNSLVEFWKDFTFPDGMPWVHPRDQEILTGAGALDGTPWNFAAYLTGAHFGSESGNLHLCLPPSPYEGDLDSAKIFILMLNPGFSVLDYYVAQDPAWATMNKAILRQNFNGIEFPYTALDPRLCWTGGYIWWERKLRKSVQRFRKEIEEKTGNRLTYFDALQFTSKRLASIEACPYHSESFALGNILNRLPSAIAAKNYVHEILKKRAAEGEITILVPRSRDFWGLTNGSGVVCYENGQARAASLGPETPCGQALVARLVQAYNEYLRNRQ